MILIPIETIKNESILPKIPDLNLILFNANQNNVKYLNNKQWKKLDKYEIDEGIKRNKIREKVTSKEKMLEIALN